MAAPRPPGLPPPPPLPAEARDRAAAELEVPERREAYAGLDAVAGPARWREAVAALEAQDSPWALVSALWHPSPDVHLAALAALERLGDAQVVPAVLPWAEAMAVPLSGSEAATVHGLVHGAVARTLSSLTGVEVGLSGQDPEGLRDAVARWRSADEPPT